MQTKDIQLIMGEVASVVRRYVSTATEPISTRIGSIEEKINALPVPKDGRDGADGKDADPNAVADVVFLLLEPEIGKMREEAAQRASAIEAQSKAWIDAAFAAVPIPKDGRDADPEQAADLVWAKVNPHMESLQKEAELNLSVLKAEAKTWITDAVSAIPKPKDGQSVTVDDVRPLIEDAVSRAVSAIPEPQDVSIVPDEVAVNVAKAVRFMAETPVVAIAQSAAAAVERSAPVSIHMPEVHVPAIEIPPIVIPEIKAPAVNVTVEQPKKRKVRKTVEAYDPNGRIKKVLEEELD